MTNIQINVKSGTITCSPSVVRALQNSTVAWKSNEEFTLTFQALDGTGPVPWPFVGPEPSWPRSSFQGNLNAIAAGAQAPAYKYTVMVGGKALDPIIIVDKN